MIVLDYKTGIPICNQVVNGIIRLRALGAISPDEQLPSVRVLASNLSVNPNTVAKAYSILEERGVIYSVKGKGSFVCDDKSSNKAVSEVTKKEFSKAIETAVSLGLSKDTLISLVEEYFREEEE